MLAQTTAGETVEGEYNTVLFAIGRYACTENIGLDRIGVQLNPKYGPLDYSGQLIQQGRCKVQVNGTGAKPIFRAFTGPKLGF